MNKPEPTGAFEDLEASVFDAARILPLLKGHEQDLCNDLHNAATKYLSNLAAEADAPTLAFVLTELQRLSNAMKPGGRIRGPETLHPQTGNALAGLFPAAQARIIDVESGKIAAPMLGDNSQFADTLKSLTATYYQNGRVPMFGFRQSAPESLGALTYLGVWYGERPDYPVRREDIRNAVKDGFGPALKEAFDYTLQKVRDAFCLEEGEKPGTKIIRRGIRATARWELAVDISHVLTDKGVRALNNGTHSVVRDLVDAVIVYATNAPPSQTTVCSELIAKAFSTTVQKETLVEMLELVEGRLFAIDYKEDTRGDTNRRTTYLYGLALYPLLDWRRELERRMKYGDYRPDDAKLRRQTGPVVKVPNWPYIDETWPVSRKLIRLKHASGPLQNKGYLSCI